MNWEMEEDCRGGSLSYKSWHLLQVYWNAPVTWLLPACDKEADGPHYLIVGNSH